MMNNLLRANFYRLGKNIIFWLCIAAMLVYGAASTLSQWSDSAKYGNEFVTDKGFIGFVIPACVLSAVLCANFCGEENQSGCLRNKISVGCTRPAVYLSEVTVCAAASLMMCAAYLIPAVPLGMVGGSLYNGKYEHSAVAAAYMLCGAALVVSCAALFCLIAINVRGVTMSTILLFLVVLLVIWVTRQVYLTLVAPEYAYMYIDGVGITEEPVLNPRFPRGAYRTLLEIVYDLLPAGQAWQLTIYGAEKLWRLPVCSAAVTALSVPLGTLIFSRKDLK